MFGPPDRPDFGLEYGHNPALHGHGHLMVSGGPGEPPSGHPDVSRLDHHDALVMNRLDRESAMALDRFDRVGVAGDMCHLMESAQAPPPHAHFGHPGLLGHHHPHSHLQGNLNSLSPAAIHDRLRASPPLPDHRHHNSNNNSNNKNNNNSNPNNNNNNTNTTNNNNSSDIRHDTSANFERLDSGPPDTRVGGGGSAPAQDFSNGNILGVRADANMNVKQCPLSDPARSALGPHDLSSDCSDLKGDPNGYSPYTLLQDRSNVDHHRRHLPPLTAADLDTPGFCAGCGGRILDRYYLFAVEKQWHTHCLTCTDCHFRLDSEITCFAKDGNIYCKTDYYR
ncbi:LIM/homeobox protein Lhx9 [Elysia marginata]|uniref:LIM/homeobox protein Lhx9 n=1 Tax=Elysia marginata TaxID=1093978 RepID=A0AAV4FP16_9GAST|nr:LIM/homeobox protein Lhx9 [Elysia marginata]